MRMLLMTKYFSVPHLMVIMLLALLGWKHPQRNLVWIHYTYKWVCSASSTWIWRFVPVCGVLVTQPRGNAWDINGSQGPLRSLCRPRGSTASWLGPQDRSRCNGNSAAISCPFFFYTQASQLSSIHHHPKPESFPTITTHSWKLNLVY